MINRGKSGAILGHFKQSATPELALVSRSAVEQSVGSLDDTPSRPSPVRSAREGVHRDELGSVAADLEYDAAGPIAAFRVRAVEPAVAGLDQLRRPAKFAAFEREPGEDRVTSAVPVNPEEARGPVRGPRGGHAI